jgi:hypothetical protein
MLVGHLDGSNAAALAQTKAASSGRQRQSASLRQDEHKRAGGVGTSTRVWSAMAMAVEEQSNRERKT